MKKFIFLLFLTTLTLFAMAKKQKSHGGVDDWDYNATNENNLVGKKSVRNMPMVSMSAGAPLMKMKADNLGFSVGGAKDADNFYQNIKNGYLPKLKSITYEGVFYDHYFKSPTNGVCENLFCPTYVTSSRKNLFTDEEKYFLSVSLDSNIKESDFKRKKLNIVVVLDISGSMNSQFDKYYYDKVSNKNQESTQSKMQIANQSLVGMIDHLGDEDRLGIVLFDNNAYNAKPLRLVKDTNIEAIKKHIKELKSRGGTNWSAGFKRGVSYFDNLEANLKDPTIYENRIIFLTDAMPNRGELSENGLFGMVKKASKNGIYTTFIGVGVDFNTDLVEAVSKTKGANYYSVHSKDEFLKRMDEEFDYMVTPLVFDLKLHLQSNSNSIEAVYGSPEANLATGELMSVNTLFPSPTKDGKTKGGVILLKVKNKDAMNLTVSYKDRSGKSYSSSKKVIFKQSRDKSIKKAILLSDYVSLMQNWILDERKSCVDKIVTDYPISVLKNRCLIYPPKRDDFPLSSRWERKSCPLMVSEGYRKLFSIFSRYFKNNISQFSDDSFTKEIEALELLTTKKAVDKNSKLDDWQVER